MAAVADESEKQISVLRLNLRLNILDAERLSRQTEGMPRNTENATGLVPVLVPDAGVASPEPGLAEGDLASLDQIGRRLRDELGQALAALVARSGDWRSPAHVHRLLGVDKTLCQRVIAAAAHRGIDREVLLRCPGVEGLRAVVSALARAGLDAGVVSGVEAATDQFQGVLRRLGVSQSGLARRLGAGAGGTGGGAGGSGGVAAVPGAVDSASTAEARERAFLANAQVLGHASESTVTVFAYRPNPENPTRLQSTAVRGVFGYRARRGAVPMVVSWGGDREMLLDAAMRTLDGARQLGKTPGTLMSKYCSQPLPEVSARTSGLMQVLTIDQECTSRGRAIDVVVASHTPDSMPHPTLDTPPHLEVWSQVVTPTRRSVLDVWVHRSLAQSGLPSLGLYVTTAAIGLGRGRDWTNRVASDTRLELLGEGLGQAATPVWDRHPELLTDLFGAVGWTADEMVGFRCQQDHPLVGTSQCFALDFEPRTPATGG